MRPASMALLLHHLGRAAFLRYAAASVIALAADFGAFVALLDIGAPSVPSSAASYALGIVVHWSISSRAVFSASVEASGQARLRQQALFVASALAGLALTSLIVDCGSGLGFDPRLAKLAAVGASFITTWLLRSRVVFATRRA